MHRDFKTANILVDRKGFLKICDFGMSCYVKKGEKLYDKCGSPTIYAPEMVRGGGYNVMIDWWALGVTLY